MLSGVLSSMAQFVSAMVSKPTNEISLNERSVKTEPGEPTETPIPIHDILPSPPNSSTTPQDAFSIMMRSARKNKSSNRTERPRKRQKRVTCAFGTMMEAATFPGAFDGPESSDVDNDTAEVAKSEDEDDPEVKKLKSKMSYKLVYFDAQVDHGWDWCCEDDGEGDAVDEDGTSTRKRPIPLVNSPSDSATLRGIKVHYNTTEGFYLQNRIQGFSFLYTDDVEVEIGNAAPKIQTLLLGDGEHITTVCAWYRKYNPKHLTEIQFKTSTNRTLQMEEDGGRFIAGGAVMTRMSFGKDRVLKSFTLCPCTQQITSWNSQPLSDIKNITSKNREISVPSLAHLARRASEHALRTNALYVEDEAKKNTRALQSRTNRTLHTLVHKHRCELESSAEATAVRHLRSSLCKAESRLRKRAKIIKHKLFKQCETTRRAYHTDLFDVKYEWARERDAALKSHIKHLDLCKRMYLEDNDRCLCGTPTCRVIYNPNKVPTSKRCSHDECRCQFNNCGCGVKECPTCMQRFCFKHMVPHKDVCKKRPVVETPSIGDFSQNGEDGSDSEPFVYHYASDSTTSIF